MKKLSLIVILVSITFYPAQGEWNALHPQIGIRDITGLCRAGDNIVGVGTYGTIVSWDGAVWSALPRFTNLDLSDVWGTSLDNIYCVGCNGIFAHWNGEHWQRLPVPEPVEFDAIHGFSNTDMYLVGNRDGHGRVCHWDGTNLTVQYETESKAICSIWGADPQAVYAVGDDGLILKQDEQTWHEVDLGVDDDFVDVHGISGDDVYVVSSTSLHHLSEGSWKGHNWDNALPTTLYDMVCLDSDNVYCFGSAFVDHGGMHEDHWGIVAHWDGETETVTELPGLKHLYAGCAVSETEWIAAGIDGFSVSNTESIQPLASGTADYLSSIRVTQNGTVYTGGSDSDYLIKYKDNEWSYVPGFGDELIFDMHSTNSDELFVATSSGKIHYWDESTWLPVNGPDSGTIVHVCGFSGDDIFVVIDASVIGGGTEDSFPVYHWNGSEWVNEINVDSIVRLGEMWGTGPDDLYIVTLNMIYHRTESGWSEDQPFEDFTYTGIHGIDAETVYVACFQGLISWDGSVWSVVCEFPEELHYPDLWVDASEKVYVSDRSMMYLFDRGIWSRIPCPANRYLGDILDLCGDGAGNVYVSCYGGRVLLFNGDILDSGAELTVNDTSLEAGDKLKLTCRIANSEYVSEYGTHYVLLDVYSATYWFWPDWAENPEQENLEAFILAGGEHQDIDVFHMTWPDLDLAEPIGFSFWSALVQDDMVLGEISRVDVTGF